ncbi:MAG: hypothetical protein IPK11_01330 [Ignavibacteria bacterium]|nr:hypothetical protein [Ignavibacteria bacterium]
MVKDITHHSTSVTKEEETRLQEMISCLISVEKIPSLLEEINTMLEYPVKYSPIFIAELYGIEECVIVI